MSLSDFERDLIIENYKFAEVHFLYCRAVCKFDHTSTCRELAQLHNRSYIRCHSHYCKKYNSDYGYSITYEKNALAIKNLGDYSDLHKLVTYYSDDEEHEISYSDDEILL